MENRRNFFKKIAGIFGAIPLVKAAGNPDNTVKINNSTEKAVELGNVLASGCYLPEHCRHIDFPTGYYFRASK